MKLILKNWLLLALCLFQYGKGSSDHRRDGPIPYPIRLMDPIPLLQLPSKRDSSNNAHSFSTMQFSGPMLSDSMMPFNNNQPQHSPQTVNFRSHAEKPFSQQFHRFELTDRDAATAHDRRTSGDFILSALQSSNFSPMLPSSISATRDSSLEARLDTNAPFASSNRQPDNLRDYAFLEDSEDHRIPISITAPIPTILTHPVTRSTKSASSKPQTSTTKNPQTSLTLSSRAKKTQTSTSTSVRFPQTSESKSSNRNQTKNETARSELRMNSNNPLNQHHEIKRSPQQELLYTPSFRRRNNANSNAASIFNNFNTGINPNSGTNNFQHNTGSRNSGNRGYENNGGYGMPSQKLPNNGNSNNPAISSSNGYANPNQPNLNNGGYDNLNIDYNIQQIPFGGQGIYSNAQFPMHANNYNLVPIFAPHLPLTYRNQQPAPLNAYSGLNSIAYPFHLIPAGALYPNYLTAPPAFASLSMVNPSSAGVFTTSPVLANNLNLVNPFLKLYSQPLISSVPAMPAPLMLAPIPYGQPLPTAPIYRNTNFQPNLYPEAQRPFPNQFDHDHHDDDDDDDDSDHHHNGFNNEQHQNYLPPIYISNNGNQNQGNFQSSSPFIPINSNEHSSNPIYTQGYTGNTATPGLISDSFPQFQPGGTSFPTSNGEPATYDADFVNRPKKVHRNRVKTGNRYNEETTSMRPNNNGFGNKVTQHIPRVEPAEGRANKDMTGVNRLLLPQNSTDMNSTTTTDNPLVIFTTELPTTSIVINNITLEEMDTDGTDDDDNDHINITITEPAATTIKIAQDRISDLLPDHHSNLYVGLPLSPDSSISIHQPFQGFSINNPFLSNILKSKIESVISPTTISIENNFMEKTHLCTDLFGRKIPNCKIAPTFVPKSTNNKLKPKNKSFNSQLFEIVEGGVFTEPTHQNNYFRPSYIFPPSHTMPVSQFERLLYHDDFKNDHEAMSESPEIVPKQFQPFYSPFQRPRSMTYDRHSALITQGHPALMKSRFN